MEEMYAEDTEFDPSAVFTDIAPMRGKDNIRRYWQDLRHTWAGLRLDPVDVFDVGDGRYVTDLRLWGKGKRSGAEVEQRFALLYDMRPDGKVSSVRMLPDLAAAMSEAASSASQPA
jgi:ketosteroid isomerase-like protein